MSQIIYELTVDDLQTVAQEELDRELSLEEIKEIKELIAERINWYDAIAYAIADLKSSRNKVSD
jgi:shikimate kinase